MKLDHIAVWTRDIERLAAFWRETFDAEVGPLQRIGGWHNADFGNSASRQGHVTVSRSYAVRFPVRAA